MLMRLDVYNPLSTDAKVTIHAPETHDVTFTVKAHQLERVKTGWTDRVSSVTLESDVLPSLLFDNLAYSPYLWGAPARSE
jgi:hypothetical protein